MFEQEPQHPLIHAERRVHRRPARIVEGAQAGQGQLEVRPVLLQAHECLEITLQSAAGLPDLIFLRAEEEGVDVDGRGYNEHVADHDVEAFAARGLVAVVEEIAEVRGVEFAAFGVLAGVRHRRVAVGGQELIKEQLIVVVITQVQRCKCLAETS